MRKMFLALGFAALLALAVATSVVALRISRLQRTLSIRSTTADRVDEHEASAAGEEATADERRLRAFRAALRE